MNNEKDSDLNDLFSKNHKELKKEMFWQFFKDFKIWITIF